MGEIVYTDGVGIPHGSFEKEFLTHRKCSEWWYCTGCLNGAKENLYAFQFTLANIRILGVKFHLLICSVTDVQTGAHYNTQSPVFFNRGIKTTESILSCGTMAKMTFASNEHASKGHMTLHMESKDFLLDVELDAVKPPVWHCEDGMLQMGILDDPKERTYYYSVTNLATKGRLVIKDQAHENLTGQTWFDRQGGTFTLTDPKCAWEWFSLRFFDKTETMLFAFPQDNYYDGTRIKADGCYHRLNDYRIEAIDVLTCEGRQFSSRWNLSIEGKNYELIPVTDGMFNIFFFELLAEIRDETGHRVGYAFIELLPGVRNKNNPLQAFLRKR